MTPSPNVKLLTSIICLHSVASRSAWLPNGRFEISFSKLTIFPMKALPNI